MQGSIGMFEFPCFPICLVFSGSMELAGGIQKLGRCFRCVDHCLAVVKSLVINL